MVTRTVGVFRRHVNRLKLRQNIANLQALFQVIVLVGINQLKKFTAVENNCVVLVVGFSITENWITGQLDAELGATTSIWQWLTVSVHKSREPT